MNDKENNFSLLIDDTTYSTKMTPKFKIRKKYVAPDPNKLLAFIPGTIREIFVKQGDKVKAGEGLLILEAMKMRNEVKAQYDTVIKKIYVKSGDIVMKNQIMVEFDSD